MALKIIRHISPNDCIDLVRKTGCKQIHDRNLFEKKNLAQKKHRDISKLSTIICSSMSSRLVVPQSDASSGKGKYWWMSFEGMDLFIKDKYSF